MVDPATNKALPGCHRSGVTIPISECIGGRRLAGAVAQLGTSASEVSPFTTIEALPIHRVLH
jgi:hypothetical protein